MPFTLTNADQNIVSQAVMRVYPNPDPISGFPGSSNGEIAFQFPPRITSENKDMMWEIHNQFNWEPMVIWQGAGARKVNFEAEYVVTSRGNGPWTIQKIADITKTFKAYFYHTAGDGAVTNMPLIQFRIYEHAPDYDVFWRSSNCNITHNGALLNINNQVWPLITKVTMTLELITKIQVGDGVLHQMDAPVPAKPRSNWY